MFPVGWAVVSEMQAGLCPMPLLKMDHQGGSILALGAVLSPATHCMTLLLIRAGTETNPSQEVCF